MGSENARKTVTAKFAVYLHNMGDGSVAARLYKDTATAERAADLCSERNCDDVVEKTLVIDAETGEIVSGLRDLRDDLEDHGLLDSEESEC